MADNSVRTPGSGETIRTIEKSAGAFKTQTVQLDVGSGTAESLVTSANPLPIYNPDDVAQATNVAMSSTANAATVSSMQGVATAAVQITGTWTGTVIFEGSIDGSTFFTAPGQAIGGAGALVSTATANGQWQIDIGGFSAFRVRCSVTGTGTAVVTIRGSEGCSAVAIDLPLPAGSNIIGKLTANQSVNVAQINGVTTTMGNGVSGTGVQRVTIASDSTGNIATIGTSVTPGTAAANLGKAEDAVAASGDTGVAVLAIRADTPPTNANVSANGDYAAHYVDIDGRLYVNSLPARVATATLTNVAASATSVSLLASNTSRKGVILFNDSGAILYLKFGATASATSFTYRIDPGATWEMAQPFYTGAIDGIWATATGTARVTELS